MLLDFTFALVCVCGVMVCAQGKVCGPVDVRTSVRNLEKLRNCTKIIGYLRIVLFEIDKGQNPFEGYSFPELTEVTDHVLVFRVFKLRTLAGLFPNLRVIRGKKLVDDYSLIIHSNDDLEQIGLYSLMYIERGGVIIDLNPKLCYYDTIDWYAINATEVTLGDNGNCRETCKARCKGYCWDEDHCQKMNSDKCHSECLSCSKPNSASHCDACKHYFSDGVCVEKCPSDRFINEDLKRCVTEKECNNILNDKFFTFKNKCISKCPQGYERVDISEGNCRYCGNNCTVYCETLVVNSISSAQKLSGCTHINGSLEIRVSRESVVKELEKHLGSIRYIRDSLKIARSNAISSLEFLRSLEEINGLKLERRAALFVYENQNLKRLWNFTNFHLKINNGTIGFHNNPQLCYSEIEALINITGLKNVSDVDVSRFSNGDEAICSPIDMKVSIIENSTNVTLTWEEPPLERDETVIGYTIYYTNYTKRAFDVMESETVCNYKGWESSFVDKNKYVIPNLHPYEEYAFYIKTYTSKTSKQSNIGYFKTLSGDPSEIIDLEVNATSYNTIRLKWTPPEQPNGVLSHYLLTVYMVEDDKTLADERNYCLHPQVQQVAPTPEQFNYTENECCAATRPSKTTFTLHNMLSYFCTIQEHRLHSWNNNACYKTAYHTDHPGTMNSFEIQNSIMTSTRTYWNMTINDGNATSYDLKDLEHYRLHALWLAVCNKDETKTRTSEHLCSPYIFAYARTLKWDAADDIRNLTLKDVVSSSVHLTWDEPKRPNSLILAYNIEHKKIDVSHSQSIVECVTRRDFLLNNSIYKIHKLLPGKYQVRVQTVSLAGKGRFSEFIYFEIYELSPNYQWLPILLSFFCILLIASSVIYYFWYRRKIKLENIYLITSVNPDYAGTMYVEDDWEMSRDDLEINEREIGHGIFGKVFTGIIKSRNMPCAIKTVNDTASYTMRMEFLNEASVMKSFSTAHHVVKLLGVVSRGPAPLVVMELMERGDLKTYLRRTRDSSHNVTSNEMYRMAAEIADGMTYLAAKKFVHRDLAARNCMIGYDRTVKIGDFGMARDIYETDYYRKETKGLLPVRWMAPESLADGMFTSDSDVWSYGIVLWEIATLAEQPYQGLSNEQVLQFVISRGKPDRPPECPDLLYEIMSSCWAWTPHNRPLFSDIVARLENCVGEDFRLVSYYHSQEGRDHRMNHSERAYNTPALDVGADTVTYNRYNDFDEDVELYVEEEPDQLLPYGNQRNRPYP